jgi:hypothetical protein
MDTKKIIIGLSMMLIIGMMGAAALMPTNAAGTPNPPVTNVTGSLSILSSVELRTNSTKISLEPTDILTLEAKNLTNVNFAVTALNDSQYSWTLTNTFGLPTGANLTGYQFQPINGTLYRIAVLVPAGNNQSVLVYKNVQLVYNGSSDVTLIINSTRPIATQPWSILWGSLNIKADLPSVSGIDIELVIAAFGCLLIFLGHRRTSNIIMFIGMFVLLIIGFITLGLIAVIVLLAYIFSYALLNRLDKRKQNPSK